MNHGPTLGILPNQYQKCDAVHIAIAPVIADCLMNPGQRVGFIDDTKIRVGPTKKPIGIIDPFLGSPVDRDQRCWMLLFPNSVTSLRHEWTHPAFSENPDKAMAEIWIRNFAEQCDGLSYEEIMSAANDYVEGGRYFSQGPRFGGIYVPDEFWEHYEIITGKKSDGGSFFSCSC